MTKNDNLAEQDFHAWTQATAVLIRQGHWSELSPEIFAAEVESLGKRDRRELGSRLQTLLRHLFKWTYQPAERSGSWHGTIRREPREMAAVLSDSLSLRRHVHGLLSTGYPEACLEAHDETGFPLATFPETCAWDVDAVLAAHFWPGA
ncbi:MAG: DUF29 domain-containing protein [Candidatus Tectimicrobiota bacterium]